VILAIIYKLQFVISRRRVTLNSISYWHSMAKPRLWPLRRFGIRNPV